MKIQIDKKDYYSLSLFLLVLFIMVLRAPNLLIYPRFFAEEGSVHFRFSYNHDLIDSLFFVYWRAGYYNLVPNLGSKIASYFPLEFAPVITTIVSFSIQAIPFAIIIFGNSLLFRGSYKKLLGISIILLSPSVIRSGEVWLNTINSQVWFGLIGLLILLEDFQRTNKIIYFYRPLVFIGGLTGLYFLILYPLFLIRALLEKNKELVVYVIVLTMALIIQTYVFLESLQRDVLNEKRFSDIGIDSIYSVFVNQLIIPIFGPIFKDIFIYSFDRNNGAYILIGLLVGLFISLFFASIFYSSLKNRDFINGILFLAWIGMAIFTILASFEGNPGGRYAVISGWIVSFILIRSINFEYTRILSIIASMLLLVSLVYGSVHYTEKKPAFECDGENWKYEVLNYKENNDYKLQICPNNWSLNLGKN